MITSVDGSLDITGTSVAAGDNNRGVALFGDTKLTTTETGNLRLTGTGGGTSPTSTQNDGLHLGYAGAMYVRTLGTGTIELRGTKGAGTVPNANAIYINNNSANLIATNDQPITMTGDSLSFATRQSSPLSFD